MGGGGETTSFGNFFCIVKESRAEDASGHMGSQKGVLKLGLGRRVLLDLDWSGLKVQRKHL